MKICSKCNTEKPTDQFNRDKTKKDGLQSYCRECGNLRKRKWRADNPDYVREYYRKWCSDNPDQLREYHREYKAAYPEKIIARNTLKSAIRYGKLTRPDHCSQCGKQCTPDGHHHSYDPKHWLDVIWLCRGCHMRLHAELDRKEA